MSFRKLRITWSVGWGLAAVSLIVLWARSYWWCDVFVEPHFKVGITSIVGVIYIEKNDLAHGLVWESIRVAIFRKMSLVIGEPSLTNFRPRASLKLPTWLIILFPATLTAIPWIRWRFSLRTLLIATTVVAVVLGLAVWASR